MEEKKAVAACGGGKAEILLELRTGQSEIQKTFNQLKVQLKTSRSSGISYIEEPDRDVGGTPTRDTDAAVSWRQVTDPPAMEDIF
jgi:hypothetical protein